MTQPTFPPRVALVPLVARKLLQECRHAVLRTKSKEHNQPPDSCTGARSESRCQTRFPPVPLHLMICPN